MPLSQEQIEQVQAFQGALSENDEWLFFNISALRALEEGGPVTYEDKYDTMQRWEVITQEH